MTDGDYVYPSIFSGAYLDRETYELCIALTDCSDDVQEQYDHFFSGPSIVVYKEAEYYYNKLKEYDTTQICSEVDPELPVVFYQSNEIRPAALQEGDHT